MVLVLELRCFGSPDMPNGRTICTVINSALLTLPLTSRLRFSTPVRAEEVARLVDYPPSNSGEKYYIAGVTSNQMNRVLANTLLLIQDFFAITSIHASLDQAQPYAHADQIVALLRLG
jgi:hypothetical protein